ncbi:hypothetical protein FX016_23075 [Cupriavidus gilardii]|nr:hypothetical protein FX016_23075 [Cupriavidus gilardii]
MRFPRLLFNALLPLILAVAAPAHADGPARAGELGWKVRQPTRFVVSAVLVKNDNHEVIKPVHGIVTAGNESDALVIYMKRVTAAYAGYSLVSTLASRVPEVGECVAGI